MIVIFQLSDWYPKPIRWAIIVKFDQIRKNWWRISCAEILEVGKNCFAASSVKKMSRFEKVSPEEIKRIAWKFTKTVILLELPGYELIITNSAYGLVGYIYQLISGASSKNNLITVAGAVTYLAIASIGESDDSCFWNAFFFSIAFFQLQNPFFPIRWVCTRWN